LQEQAQEEKPSFLVAMAIEKYNAFMETYQGATPVIDALDKAGFMLVSTFLIG
jgi:hypothetical protein